MNQAHEPLDDPQEGRLTEIERHLRKARPMAPQLDLAAIERLARETPPSDEEPRVILKPSVLDDGRGQRIRSYATVAGSWICGAVVGAAAMFFHEGRPASDVTPLPRATIAEDTTSKSREMREDVPRPPRADSVDLAVSDNTGARDTFWLASAELMNLNGHGPHRSTWRVGMSLPSLAAASRWNVDGTQDTDLGPAWELPASGSAAPPAKFQDLESTPDVTRQQLLRELLGSAAGPAL